MTERDVALMMDWAAFLERGMKIYREDPAPHERMLCVGRLVWGVVMGAMDAAAAGESAVRRNALALRKAFVGELPPGASERWPRPLALARLGRQRLVRAIFEMEHGALPHPWG